MHTHTSIINLTLFSILLPKKTYFAFFKFFIFIGRCLCAGECRHCLLWVQSCSLGAPWSYCRYQYNTDFLRRCSSRKLVPKPLKFVLRVCLFCNKLQHSTCKMNRNRQTALKGFWCFLETHVGILAIYVVSCKMQCHTFVMQDAVPYSHVYWGEIVLIYMHTWVHAFMYITSFSTGCDRCLCIYVYMCMYVYLCMYMYIHTYTYYIYVYKHKL